MGIKIAGTELTFTPNKYRVITKYNINDVLFGSMTVNSTTYAISDSISQLNVRFTLRSIIFASIFNHYNLSAYTETIDVSKLTLVNTSILTSTSTAPQVISCSASFSIDESYLYMTVTLPSAYTNITRFFGYIKYNSMYLMLSSTDAVVWNMSATVASITQLTGMTVNNYMYCSPEFNTTEYTDEFNIQSLDSLPLAATGTYSNTFIFSSIDVTTDTLAIGTNCRWVTSSDLYTLAGKYNILGRTLNEI